MVKFLEVQDPGDIFADEPVAAPAAPAPTVRFKEVDDTGIFDDEPAPITTGPKPPEPAKPQLTPDMKKHIRDLKQIGGKWYQRNDLGIVFEHDDRGQASRVVEDPFILNQFGQDQATKPAQLAIDAQNKGLINQPRPKPAAVSPAAREGQDPRIDYGTFMNSFLQSAGPQNLELTGHTLGAFTDLSGDDTWAKDAEDLIRMGEQGAKSYKAPPVRELKDIGGIGDAWEWTKQAAGQGLGSTIVPFAGGVIGGGVGKKLGGKFGGTVGAIGGALTGSASLNIGSMRKTLIEEGVKDPKLRGKVAVVGGMAMASLDSLLPGEIAEKFTGGLRREVEKSIAKRILKGLGKGSLKEGLTEGAQGAVEEVFGKVAAEKQIDVWHLLDTIVENAAAGAVGGAVMGAGGGLAPAGDDTNARLDEAVARERARRQGLAPAPTPQRQTKGDRQAVPAEEAVRLLRGAGYTREDIKAMSPEQYAQILTDLRAQGAKPAAGPEPTEPVKPPPGTAPVAPKGKKPPVEPPISEAQPAVLPPVDLPVVPGWPDQEAQQGADGLIGDSPVINPSAPPGEQSKPTDTVSEPIALPDGRKLVEVKGEDVFGDGTRAKPVTVEDAGDLEPVRTQVAPEPTDGQKEAGNYKKGHAKVHGMKVSIETAKGGKRTGINPTTGERWEVDMEDDYGQILGTKGADGEQIDIFIGPNPSSDRVFIIDQKDPDTGKFDEHKVITGAETEAQATEIYERGFSDTKQRVMSISEVDVDTAKEWAFSGPKTEPYSKDTQKPLKSEAEPERTDQFKRYEKWIDENAGALVDKRGVREQIRMDERLDKEETKALLDRWDEAEEVFPGDEETPGSAEGPTADEIDDLTSRVLDKKTKPKERTSLQKQIDEHAAKAEAEEGAAMDAALSDDKKVTEVWQRTAKRFGEHIADKVLRDAKKRKEEAGPGKPAYADLTEEGRRQLFVDNGIHPRRAKHRAKVSFNNLDIEERRMFAEGADTLTRAEYQAMGAKAFAEGKPARVPADIITKHGNAASEAWSRGWHNANLGEKVPGVSTAAHPDEGKEPKTRPPEKAEEPAVSEPSGPIAEEEAETRPPTEEPKKPDIETVSLPGAKEGSTLAAIHVRKIDGKWAFSVDYTAENMAYRGGEPGAPDEEKFTGEKPRRFATKEAAQSAGAQEIISGIGGLSVMPGTKGPRRDAIIEWVRQYLPKDIDGLDPLVVAFRDRLLDPDGGFATIVEARAFAAERGFVKGEDADNKVLEEKIELAVVLAARETVEATRKMGRSVGLAYDRLVNLYKRQPKLGTRTSKSMAEQAYSTPAPIAFLASRLAHVDTAKSVMEPTAGNGMLLMEAPTGSHSVTANEIDGTRADNLRAQGFYPSQKDAAKQSLRHKGYPVQAIVMNPPFGAVLNEKGRSESYKVGDWETTRIDYAIALRQLESLADDGRAVLILGGPAKTALSETGQREFYRAKAQREFYWRLAQDYNVVDQFTIRGELYSRQGAGWPIDVIVIDGRGKSARPLPGVTPPPIFDTFEALKEKLDGQAFGQRGPDRERERPPAAPDRGEPEPEISDAGSAEPAGERGSAAPQREADERIPVRDGRPDRQPGIPGDGGLAPRGDDAEPGPGVIDRTVDKPGDSEPSPPRLAEPVSTEPGSGESALQRKYKPSAKAAKSLGMLVPANMQTATQDALAAIGEDVDGFVARNLRYREDILHKHFANEQLDAIALAIKEYQRGGALIIGDQTGAGKGRVVAALIRYALIQGQVPVFVTEKPDLYGDMFRDMNDIGLPAYLKRDVGIFATNSSAVIPLDDEAVEWKGEYDEAKKAGDALPARRGKFLKTGSPEAVKKAMAGATAESVPGYDVVFTTYDQTNTVKGADTERRAFLRKMMPNAFLILDESHNAGGGDQGGWDVDPKGAVNRADFIRELVDKAKGVMYSSATYAKRPDVMDLYRRTDMAKAVKNIDDLGETIAKGGVPLQQVTAAMLASQGQYIRRERSFEGITYDLTEIDVDRDTYNNFSRALRAVQQFDLVAQEAIAEVMGDILAESGLAVSKDPSVGVAGASQTGFSSVMHNLINQMLLAIKVEGTVLEALQVLERGDKPVIALSSTMESFMDQYVEDKGLGVGDTINLTFKDALKRYLDRSLRITVKNHDKTTTHIQVPIERLESTVIFHKNALDAIEESGVESLPISPIDALRHGIEKAGYKVKEITGRKRVIDYSGKKPKLKARDSGEMGSGGKRVSVKSFNDGKTDVIIFNRSGSTGISMHSGPSYKDQRKRVMLIVQAEGNIDTHMQTLGRTNRTGQLVLPGYKQLAAKIPAEARPAAVLLRKMASLNASTTASRKGALNDESIVDFINQYGDQVVWDLMHEHGELHAAMNFPLGADLGRDRIPGAAAKVTGKMTLLNLDEQEMLLDAIARTYKAFIAQLDATGENMLEAKSLDLQARPLSIKEMKPRTGTSVFEDGIYAEWSSVKSDGKSYGGTDLVQALADEIGESNVTKENRVERWREIARKMGTQRDPEWQGLSDTATAYAKASAAAIKDPAAAERELEKQRDLYRRFNGLWHVLTPGGVITIKGKDGAADQDAVVIWTRRTGAGKNPIGLGSWEVKLALPSSYRTLNVPFSQLYTPAFEIPEGGRGMNIDVPRDSTRPERMAKVLEAFDDAAKSGREDRWIFTGNLLGGYEMVGRGQVINFTSDDGRLRQGVLMPKEWDLADFNKKRPIEFGKPEQVVEFLEKAEDKSVMSRDGLVDLVVSAYGRQVEIAASRALGGKYFLHPAVRKATEDKLTKAGTKVRWQTVNRPMFEGAIKALMTAGARFQVTHEQDLANSIVNPEKGPPEGPGGGEFRPAQMPTAEKGPIFYSGLLRTVMDKGQPKASARQWMAMIRNAPGVKKEELEWLGLEEWLAAKGDEPVTRHDVAEFINANQIQIDEVDKSGSAAEAPEFEFSGWGDPDVDWTAEAEMYLDEAREALEEEGADPSGPKYEYWLNQYALAIARDRYEAQEQVQRINATIEGKVYPFLAIHNIEENEVTVHGDGKQIASFGPRPRGRLDRPDEARLERVVRDYLEKTLGVTFGEDYTEFSSYVLPGGENYHELLLTLPVSTAKMDEDRREELRQLARQAAMTLSDAERERLRQLRDEWTSAIAKSEGYGSPHWKERNVLAHVRFNDRTDADGKRVLFLEEIQSDWHQQGRDRGYDVPGRKVYTVVSDGLQRGQFRTREEAQAWADTHLDRVEGIREVDAEGTGVPDAPFKTSWPELAMKRMIRWAAENGYDRIAWTPGSVQADRYDLSKQVSEVAYAVDGKMKGTLQIFGPGRNGVHQALIANPTMKSDADLADHIGKAAAEKLINHPTKQFADQHGSWHILSGLDLKVGGEGMLGFYDKMLVDVANKLGKKFGAKAGKTKITTVPFLRSFEEYTRRIGFAVGEIPSSTLRKQYDESVAREAKEIHAMDIPPAMREAAMEGQPIFDRGDGFWRTLVKSHGLDKITDAQIDQINAMAQKILGHKIKVGVVGSLPSGALGEYSAQKRTIFVTAAAALGEPHTLHHEVIHAFRDAGIITAPEWGVLRRWAIEEVMPSRWWQEAAQAWKHYEGWDFSQSSLEELMIEEAIAEAFTFYVANDGRQPVTPLVETIFRKLKEFLDRVRAMFAGAGFKTVEDIFGDIAQGRMRDRPMFEPGRTGRSWGFEPRLGLPAEAPAEPRPAQPPTRRRMPASRNVRRSFMEPDDDPISVLTNRNLPMLTRLSGGLANAYAPVRKAIQDRMIYWKRVQGAIENQLGPIPGSADVYQAETLMPGRTGERLEDFRMDDLDPLFKEMVDLDVTTEELNEYLYANHAEERNDHVATINPRFPDGGSGMMTADAQSILAAARPEVARVARRVYRILAETRQRLLREGIIDQATYNQWVKKYRYYVPLRGWEADPEEGARPGTGMRYDSRARVAEVAMGRSSLADSPLAYVIAGAQQSIIVAEKARVGRTVLGIARRFPNTNLWEVNQVVMRRYISKATGLVTSTPDNQKKALADNVLAVRLGGSLYWVTLHHEGLAAGVRGLDAPATNTVLRYLMTFNRFLAVMRTSYSPQFFIPNFVRDAETAGLHLTADQGAGMAGKVAKDIGKAMRGVWSASRGNLNSQWAQFAREFKQAGGAVGIWGLEDIETIKKKVNRQLRRAQPGVANRLIGAGIYAREVMDHFNGAVENAVRLSTYVNMRRAGYSQDEAAAVAKELTVNFNRKGEWGNHINAAYLFANASMQGTTRVAIALSRSKFLRRVALGLFAMGILQDFMNSWLDDDDDDDRYDNAIPEHLRERNFIFMIPGVEQPFKLPQAWVYNVFHYAGTNVGRVMRGKITPMEGAANIGSALMQAANPIQAHDWLQMVMPTLLDPWVELDRNKDWKGDPIMPPLDDKDKTPPPDSQRYFPSVGPWYRMATDALNDLTGGDKVRPGAIDVSPESIEYITDYLFAGVKMTADQIGTTISKAVNGDPIAWDKVPFVRLVFGGANLEMAGRDEYYDMRDAVALTMEQFERANDEGDQPKIDMILRDYPVDIKAAPIFEETDKMLRKLKKGLNAAKDKEAQKRIRGAMEKARTDARKAYRALEEKGQAQ